MKNKQQPETKQWPRQWSLENSDHVRVRLAVALYHQPARRYREEMTIKLRASKEEIPTLLAKIKTLIATLET
jgi:hypothetical protein